MASLNPRDRNLVVLGLLSVAIAGGYWYQFWSPKNLELDEVDVHVQALRTVNQQAKAELAQERVALRFGLCFVAEHRGVRRGVLQRLLLA
jgi:type II secretory pathway component PulM